MMVLQRNSAATSVTDDDPRTLLLREGRSRIEQTSVMTHYHFFLDVRVGVGEGLRYRAAIDVVVGSLGTLKGCST